jgi:hypothetical protein
MFEVEVRSGALLLDQEFPHWVESIDIDTLDSHTHCVLSQLYGSYLTGERILCEPRLSPIEHGFSLNGDPHPNPPENWAALTQAWKNEIAVRSNAQKAK